MFSRVLGRVWKCGTRLTCAQHVHSLSSGKTLGGKSLVRNVRKDHSDKMLHVQWEDNTLNRFPYIFLRDNCQCEECFHTSAKQRSFDTVGFADIDVQVEEASVSQNGLHLSIIWPDKHKSVFESDWLRKRCMPETSDRPTGNESIAGKGVVLWDRAMLQDNIPQFEFQNLMEDECNLMSWLKTLHSHGLALVKNAPTEEGQVKKLAERVGYLKTTHYG